MITEWGGSYMLQSALMPSYQTQANWYLALCWSSPSSQSTGDTLPELMFARNYARALLPADIFYMSGGALTTNADVFFNSNSDPSNWQSASYYAVCTSAQGGNVLAWERLLAPLVVPTGLAPYFRAGAIQITMENN